VNAVNKLLNIDKVSLVFAMCSPELLAIAPILEKSQTVGFSYCATAPSISQAGDYIFRNVPSDSYQTIFAADYIYNDLGKGKAAVVYINNDWGLGLNNAFAEAFTNEGGEIVLQEAYSPESEDLRSQMAKVKNSGADVLYFAAFPNGSIAGIRQLNELGVDITMFGADAWDDPKIWQEVGSAGNGVYFTSAKTNSTNDFKQRMSEKIGSDELIYCSNYAYDGLKMLAGVISKVGVDGTEIKDELYKTKYHGEVSQPVVEFDENGDPAIAVYTLKRVEGGQTIVVE
jgi:branched-chain amino acid transport system substrate-binding protein